MNPLRYDLTDLRLFINIAEAQNLTRGAERSHLSLGAASIRIKGLEEALGSKLFVRNSQGVTLTPAGAVLKRHAFRIFQDFEKMHGDLQEFSSGLKGRLRIFANTTSIIEVLPKVLSDFLAANPHVDVDLEERLSPEIAKAVADGVVDIGLLATTGETEGVQTLTYGRDRLVLAMPRSHPLSLRGTIAFAEALSENFVSLQRGSAVHDFLVQATMAMGQLPNVRVRVSGFDAACRLIEANVGVGLLPDSIAKRLMRTHAIQIVQLTDDWADRTLRICMLDYDTLPKFARDLVGLLVRSRPPDMEKATSPELSALG